MSGCLEGSGRVEIPRESFHQLCELLEIAHGPRREQLTKLHPDFQPRSYIDFRIEIKDEYRARISIGDCPALHGATGSLSDVLYRA